MRWKLGDWDMDSSLVYGKNKMEFTIENTLNRSLGPASPTVFDAGGFDYDQLVLNLSGVRPVEVGAFASPLNVAVGIEARREEYSIFAGEPDSYRNGGVLLNGQPTASGSQVFAGFRPANAGSEDRTAVGAYVDLEANVTEKFLASVAVRGEHYSDFGENLSGKLAGRYDFTRELRAARLGAERLPRALAAAAVLRRRPRRTSSAACRSTSRRSRRPTRSRSRSARSSSMPRSRSTTRSAP